MNNRQKIENKIKKEGLTIVFLEYYQGGNTWILLLKEPVFLKNKKLIGTHGIGILKTATIEPNRVSEFCESNLQEWE